MTASLTSRANADKASAGKKPPSWGSFFARNAMLVAAIILFLAFVATSPVFGTSGNAANILRPSASVLVLGLAMTMVVLIGGSDLSVGSKGCA